MGCLKTDKSYRFMKILNLTSIILISFMLSACLPESRVAVEESTTEESTDASTDDQVFDAEALWYSSSLTTSTITLDVDNSKSIYLVGDDVQNYLNDTDNFKGSYCLEIRFTQSTKSTPKRLRVKATPTYSNNYAGGISARFFTLNIGTSLGNTYCQKSSIETVKTIDSLYAVGDSNYDGIVDSSDQEVAYVTTDICDTCEDIITSSSIILYKNNSNDTSSDTSDDYLERVSITSDIDYSTLVLRIDMNSSGNETSSCSNNTCIASGYDCCMDGQCVNEKGIKTAGIIADPSGFSIAETYKASNSNWYKNYPQFYYICAEIPEQDSDDIGDDEEDIDPVQDAEDRLTSLKADYACLVELEENSNTSPFHTNPLNSSYTYTACNITDAAEDLYYQTVMKRLYQNCGCDEEDDLDTMVETCPAYTYTPLYETDSSGEDTTNILSFSCVTPEVDSEQLPFQDQEVLVNGRAAPHRYFDTTNTEIDPTEALPSGATGEQEGTEFQYLDDYYIFPKNGDFNMNSILGQMTVSLDQARPAKVIDVEYDQQYLIKTRSGTFQPCLTCGKDSWYNNFTAFPTSTYGLGARAKGFTTRRDTYVTNSTLGNYEDTIFNRACYLPPTMLPFSHDSQSTEQDQRLLRLKTQAALYVNGYQKDWFGFNRGALIGSFDGVTWFAVGNGRIVRAKTNKLYLAINAPFADLSNNTSHTVAVLEYDSISTGAVYDYDPTKELNDSTQNEAGSCQMWHTCETDAHCITKLGWEYSCVDVNNYQTKWPSFNPTGAREIASSEYTGAIQDFLQQASLPTGSGSKRCVYRGAGAPCRTDYENINDEGIRKSLTCAPNFYCAALDSSAFNTEVARFARPLDELATSKNHSYGQDANVLGRPLHYLNTGSLSSLPSDVQSVLDNNLKLVDSTGSDSFGLCRPGKLLPSYQTSINTNNWDPAGQHAQADNKYRTDYISQIGGCNSTLYTNMRYSSCPILDEDGNYLSTQDTFISDSFYSETYGSYLTKEAATERYSYSQNACGMESISTDATITTSTSADDIANYSAFKTIEGKPLSSSNIITESTLVRDACFRKAGAVCHTDLDCSPNRMMASVVDLVDLDYFGNEAEKNYFEEYLVCGQATTEPSFGDDTYDSYTMHNNRCCRPLGETLTMYTENSPNADVSFSINTAKYGSLNPNAADRYSRYSSVDGSINTSTGLSNITRPSADTTDDNLDHILDNSNNILTQNQWKTIHNAAAKTCCGGSWVRKFHNGSHDWSKKRLSIDPTNFKCLNYKTPLQLAEDGSKYGVTDTQLQSDQQYLCLDGNYVVAGCSNYIFDSINTYDIIKPVLNTDIKQVTISTSAEEMRTATKEPTFWRADYLLFGYPRPIDGTAISTLYTESSSGYILPWSSFSPSTVADINTDVTRFNLLMEIPAHIVITDMVSQLVMTDPQSGNALSCTDANVNIGSPTPALSAVCGEDNVDGNGTVGGGGLCNATDEWTDNTYCPDSTGGNDCCFVYDETSRILRVSFSNADRQVLANYGDKDSFIRITYTPIGSYLYEEEKYTAELASTDPEADASISSTRLAPYRRTSEPGNALYYLKRLARLEYLGIPQMVYEPIYCNDSYQDLVPGIFVEEYEGSALETVHDFLSHPRTFYDSSSDTPWQTDGASNTNLNIDDQGLNQNLVTTQELIDHSPVFSDNEFVCCLELGSEISSTSDSNLCCSGNAVESETDSTKKICKLPAGTDLNVYFNKFVSGEGLSNNFTDVSALEASDFDAKTGEPLLNDEVYTKIVALGEEFCESGSVRRGAAFGDYQAQPTVNNVAASEEAYVYSIVDSVLDEETGSAADSSYDEFADGFMWNHHYYCDSGE